MSNILSSFLSPSDDLYWRLQIASLILVGLSVVVGGFTIATGWKINRRQAREIEGLKLKRLEMEKSISPRELPIMLRYTDEQGNFHETNFEILRPFAGKNVIVRILPDAEASRAASALITLCQAAGLKLVGVEHSTELNAPYFDGVGIEQYEPSPPYPEPGSPESFELQKENDLSEVTAEALVDVLESNNWVARRRRGDGTIPSHTIRINVGFKPSPYFEKPPPWRNAEDEKKREERQKKRRPRATEK